MDERDERTEKKTGEKMFAETETDEKENIIPENKTEDTPDEKAPENGSGIMTEEDGHQMSSETQAGKKKASKEDKKQKNRVSALEKEVEELKKQIEAENDKYLRVLAEYDNFRRRSQKEKDGIYSDAVADSVKELLPLFDNLERASAYEEGDKLAEGLKMILKTVPDVLSKMKVESFGEVGETFDPNVHNAIMHEENEDYGESEIVEVFQKGYKTGDKIIRHAMVKVAN